MVTPGGSVNFAAGSSGNGVYFAQCCSNTGNAYYKFTGAAVGSIFSTSPRQITFYVKSRQSFAQRVASGSSYRQVLDVRDNSTHVLGFNTLTLSGFLMLRYTIWGVSSYYIVPSGTEEKLFGNGVTLKVTLSWDGSTAKILLNDVLIKQTPYAAPTPNWTDASVFDYGAYEYLTYGGYDSCDDLIDEFTVTAPSGGLSAQPAFEAPCDHQSGERRGCVRSGGLQSAGGRHTAGQLPSRECRARFGSNRPFDLARRRQGSDQWELRADFVRLIRPDRLPLPQRPTGDGTGNRGRNHRRTIEPDGDECRRSQPGNLHSADGERDRL